MSQKASASINPHINFQGKLTNPDGTNVTNSNYSIVFSIYTVSSGGAAVWTETQPTVTVTDGIFRVSLGDFTALPGSVDFNSSSLYLGIKVSTDSEMTPRVQLTASPYAFNSDLLDGIDSTGFVKLAQGLQADSSTANASIAINKTGITADILLLQKSSADVLKVGNSGSYDYTLSVSSNPTYTITNNGTNNVITNLASTGDFVLQDNGTAFATFSDDGAITFAPTGTSDILISEAAGVNMQITATAAPTVNQVAITNAGQAVTTANVNGLSVNYVGGAAAVESAGIRIDYAPGGTTGGTWSGLRIVANSTGPATGVTSYGIKIEGPTVAGLGTGIGLKIASGFDIGLDIASGGIQLASVSATPASPAAGNLKTFAKINAGRGLLKIIGPAGLDYSVQPSIFDNKINWWTANGNATTVSTINFGNTTTGTATTRNVAVTNFLTASKRVSFVSAGTAGSSAGTRHGTAQFWLGNAANLGGFYYVTRFGANSVVATTRTFVGMSATTGALANADPSSFFNLLAFGCDAADTQFKFMHNDLVGTATKDNLTGSFPCNTGGTDLYEARIFVAPNGTTVYYSLLRVNTGDFYEASTATDLPANTTLMAPQIWINNGATATLVDMSIVSQYVETSN
ncbi:MAG: hypothetical protein WCJ60_03575 [bacterium]